MCRLQYIFRGVTYEEAGNTGSPDRTHDDQVGAELGRERRYTLGGITLQ